MKSLAFRDGFKQKNIKNNKWLELVKQRLGKNWTAHCRARRPEMGRRISSRIPPGLSCWFIDCFRLLIRSHPEKPKISYFKKGSEPPPPPLLIRPFWIIFVGFLRSLAAGFITIETAIKKAFDPWPQIDFLMIFVKSVFSSFSDAGELQEPAKKLRGHWGSILHRHKKNWFFWCFSIFLISFQFLFHCPFIIYHLAL